MKVSKNQYMKGFCLVVIALGVIRAVFPSVAMTADERRTADSIRVVEDSIRIAAVPTQENVEKVAKKEEKSLEKEEISPKTTNKSTQEEKKSTEVGQSRFFNADGTPSRHRILSVTSYSEAFPDAQEVQIVSAHKWGVSPVLNRQIFHKSHSILAIATVIIIAAYQRPVAFVLSCQLSPVLTVDGIANSIAELEVEGSTGLIRGINPVLNRIRAVPALTY